MVAAGVVVVRLTTMAPFCAAVVEIVGAVAGVWVVVVTVPPAPPHPHNKTPAKIIVVSIAAPARIPRLRNRRIGARLILP
jgi:hypothetical protein